MGVRQALIKAGAALGTTTWCATLISSLSMAGVFHRGFAWELGMNDAGTFLCLY